MRYGWARPSPSRHGPVRRPDTWAVVQQGRRGAAVCFTRTRAPSTSLPAAPGSRARSGHDHVGPFTAFGLAFGFDFGTPLAIGRATAVRRFRTGAAFRGSPFLHGGRIGDALAGLDRLYDLGDGVGGDGKADAGAAGL